MLRGLSRCSRAPDLRRPESLLDAVLTRAMRRLAPLAVLGALVLSACAPPPAGSSTPSLTPEPATASASPTQMPTPPALRTATVVMNGDLLWHNSLVMTAQADAQRPGGLDFVPLLNGVRPVVEDADLAICHNEVPIAPPGGPYSYYPTFSAPEETLDAVAAVGYDLCTTASNHSLDQGFAGLERTLSALDARGIRHVGTARTAEEAATPTIFTTDAGVKIGVVAGTYSTNGIPLPDGKPWAVDGIDPDDLLARARATRQAGADIVLIAVHAGEEYQHTPNAQQEALTDTLTASPDVDVVYGHHVHVVQPITRKNDTWVVYGLGNLVAAHRAEVPRGYEGITTRFTFTEKADGTFAVTEAEYFPTMVTFGTGHPPARLYLVNQALADGTGPLDRLQLARDRTHEIVHRLGSTDGLVER